MVAGEKVERHFPNFIQLQGNVSGVGGGHRMDGKGRVNQGVEEGMVCGK